MAISEDTFLRLQAKFDQLPVRLESVRYCLQGKLLSSGEWKWKDIANALREVADEVEKRTEEE